MLFLARAKPDSKQVKPACSRKTKLDATTTHNISAIDRTMRSTSYEVWHKHPLIANFLKAIKSRINYGEFHTTLHKVIQAYEC